MKPLNQNKMTAVTRLLEYFTEQNDNGATHWSVQDLIAQLHQAKEIEKEQIVEAFSEGTKMIDIDNEMDALFNGFIYYGETYEQS